MFIDLIVLVAVVGLLVWVFSLLPIPAPFQQIILVIGVIIVVIALLQAVFGVNMTGHFNQRWR